MKDFIRAIKNIDKAIDYACSVLADKPHIEEWLRDNIDEEYEDNRWYVLAYLEDIYPHIANK